jgi:hypothetical protein
MYGAKARKPSHHHMLSLSFLPLSLSSPTPFCGRPHDVIIKREAEMRVPLRLAALALCVVVCFPVVLMTLRGRGTEECPSVPVCPTPNAAALPPLQLENRLASVRRRTRNNWGDDNSGEKPRADDDRPRSEEDADDDRPRSEEDDRGEARETREPQQPGATCPPCPTCSGTAGLSGATATGDPPGGAPANSTQIPGKYTRPPAGSTVIVVINGGVRQEDYLTPLLASLYETGLPVFVFSDIHNFNESRGDALFPPNPADLIYPKLRLKISLHQFRINFMWMGMLPTLLLRFPQARSFLILENDAVVCDVAGLNAVLHYFHDALDPSLSLWSSCGFRGNPVGNIPLPGGDELDLYYRSACGMVATAFKRESVSKVYEALQRMTLTSSIEGAYSSSGTSRYVTWNVRVLTHGGFVTTDPDINETNVGSPRCGDVAPRKGQPASPKPIITPRPPADTAPQGASAPSTREGTQQPERPTAEEPPVVQQRRAEAQAPPR